MKVEEKVAGYSIASVVNTEEWPMLPFEIIAKPQSDRGRRIKQRDYLPEGKIPVIDQGRSPIGGYTNDEDFIFTGELPVVLFGDHTRAVKLVNHRFAVGADGIKIFRPAEGVRIKYLYYWMKSARIPDRGYGRHYQYLRQLFVPLPSQAKQDEIVAEIEKQFSRLDEAVANLKRVKANIKRYKAAVLKAAVEGRLVETEAELARREGRSFETGAQLLQRILETRRSEWQGKGKYKEPAAPDTTDLPELPEGWVWASLDQLTRDSLIGLDRGRDQQNSDGLGVPYVKMNNVTMDGAVMSDDMVYVEASDAEKSRFALKLNDLLFNTRNSNELVGKVGLVRTALKDAIYNNNLMRIRLAGSVIPSFICSQMCSDGFRRRMELVKKATTNVAAVYAKDLFPLQLALPPLAEQHRIVAEIDRHLSLANEAEVQVNANLQRAERLRQSILSRAFSSQ